MKKIFLILYSISTGFCLSAQTTEVYNVFDATTGAFGKKLSVTSTTPPYTAKKYLTGFLTWGTTDSLLTLTTTGTSGAATYTPGTGVLNIPQYAGTTYTGTTNRLTVTGSVLDIAATYVGQTSITTLGTIGTGTWNGTAIGAAYGGTGQTSVTTGDLLYGSASNVWSKLAAGTSTYVLTSNGAGVAPSWQAAGGGSGWSLTGNSGTTAGTNFWGTTDNANLIAKRNSVQSIEIDSSAATHGRTNTGFRTTGTGIAQTADGYKALSVNTGASNTAVGSLALTVNSSGVNNTAVGTGSGALNQVGNRLAALGATSAAKATGDDVTALGYNALGLATFGSSNTAGGANALGNMTSQNFNTAFGMNAGFYFGASNTALTAPSTDVFIGYLARANSNTSSNEGVFGANSIGHGSNTYTYGNSTVTDAVIHGRVHASSGVVAVTMDTTAILEGISTTKGFLPPRMTTTQRLAITSGVATATRVGGTGYTNGTYTANALTGGTGTGATATLIVAGGIVTSATFVNKGVNYVNGDVLSTSGIGAGSGFTLTVTALTAATEGLVVFDLTLHKLYVWDATTWQAAW